jgi:uncharacterized protein
MTSERLPYHLVSADQHINEPPDLWLSRVERKFADRVPRQEYFPEQGGHAWIMEGVADPIEFGLNSSAGKDPMLISRWSPWEEIRRGGYDPAARLVEMDLAAVDAGINFPTPRLTIGVATTADPELHLAMVRAYNDWLFEYCAHAPDRLFGCAVLPNCGVDEAVAELERVMGRPGFAGPVINSYPHGDSVLSSDDDPLWAAIEESGYPLTIHVLLSDQRPVARPAGGLPGDLRMWDCTHRFNEFMFSGVFDRFPGLQLVFTEVDAGWVPFFKEQLDNRYMRTAHAMDYGLTRPPSEYFDDHVACAFITDTFAIDNRYAIGVENMLWSDDFPHAGSDWPHTHRTIAASFSGIPKTERQLILAKNAVRLYHLPGLEVKK